LPGWSDSAPVYQVGPDLGSFATNWATIGGLRAGGGLSPGQLPEAINN
jgi:hypothetical protein